MKKNTSIILAAICGLVAVAVAVVAIILTTGGNTYRTELSDDKKVLIAEDAQINFAWGFQYFGKALFNDGTIYEWDGSKGAAEYSANTTAEKTAWILKYGTKLDQKVTAKELEKIENYIDEVGDDIKLKSVGNDMGAAYVEVYRDGKSITLTQTGDYSGENTTETAQKLLTIIRDYLE